MTVEQRVRALLREMHAHERHAITEQNRGNREARDFHAAKASLLAAEISELQQKEQDQ